MVRSVAVIGISVLIALLVFVRPIREQPPASPPLSATDAPPAETVTPLFTTEMGTLGASASVPTESPTLTPPPTSTPTPSDVPSPTPEPTATPTPLPSPSVVPSDTPVPVEKPSPAPLAGRIEQGTYGSQITGKQEPYRVYLPPGYDQADRRYPVLYLLHGWPYDEDHWDALGIDELADQRILEGITRPFIIVLPGADEGGLYVTTSGGAGSFEEQLVNELMRHIDATFRSVQTRDARAIGGISRGGVWSLEIAFRHPDAFGIVGAHSPALSANRAPSLFDPFTLMTEPGVGSLRIYLSAGDADWALEATYELHQALDQQSIVHEFVVHPGPHVDHLWGQHLGEYLTFYTAGW